MTCDKNRDVSMHENYCQSLIFICINYPACLIFRRRGSYYVLDRGDNFPRVGYSSLQTGVCPSWHIMNVMNG